nr:E3 ubiquitin-protein ligase RING1-like [Setaria viridis]
MDIMEFIGCGASSTTTRVAGRVRGTGGLAAVDQEEKEEEAPPAAASIARAEDAPESVRSSAELCAVCLEDVRGAAAEATALPCYHAYHPGCLLPWLAVHRACPCCRAAVPIVAARGK